MAAVKSSNTSPERALRSALHRSGVRFRLDQAVQAGGKRIRPDLAFKSRRLAVFVDGCFWHGCPAHCRMPGTNTDYWTSKIARNRARDARTTALLEQEGWKVVRVWEHDDPDEAAAEIAGLIRAD